MNRLMRGIAMALASVAWLGGCVEPPSWFPFEARRAPRLFAYHVPLVPEPGGAMNLLASVDGLTADQIEEVRGYLEWPGGDSQTQTCTPIGTSTNYNCAFSLEQASEGDELVVRASATLADGADGPSLLRADAFRMTVRSLRDDQAPQLIKAREPLAPREALEGTRYAIRTVLVRDASENFSLQSFVAAANALIHEAVLDDPVYRWRANQFAFYLYTRPAATSHYYSGKDTRCGQNPWPQLAFLPDEVTGMDAIGVLHRRAGPGVAFGGESVGGFRDCASKVIKGFELGADLPEVGTFSMKHGAPSSKRLGAHEFGHAVFGLGDEYNETSNQRTATAGHALAAADPQCCCVLNNDDTGTTDTGGLEPGVGPGVVVTPDTGSPLYCIDGDGELALSGTPGAAIANDVAACTQGFEQAAPLDCLAGDAAQACPSLRGTCVRETMWLDAASVPADAALYNNVFDSEASCNASRVLLPEHPGIEDADAGLLAACVEQCGPDSAAGPCACEPSAAYWRLDRDPVVDANVAQDIGDLMKRLDSTVHHGAACNHCVETSLCVRWERARGRSAEDTWNYCAQPPADIVEQLEAAQSAIAKIARWLRALFADAKT